MSSNIQGLLFIGDPHLSSRRPGRRTDRDFAGTVLDKLAQAMTIARVNDWQPIILGDLFDRGGDNDLLMLTRLLRLLRTHAELGGAVPFCLVGNHDLRDADLADDTAMGLLRETALIRILETGETPEVITIPGNAPVAHLLPVSYGKDRASLSGIAQALKGAADTPVIALTHEDFDFQGAYPGASIMEEIPGVDMVVNGHMHKPAPWVRRGKTIWCNPGNITRMSVDCEEFPPAVWSWTPDMGTDGLERHVLVYEKAVFDHTGLRVEANEDALREALENGLSADMVSADGVAPENGSAFAELLKSHEFGTVTEDASILREELEVVIQEKKTDEITVGILRSMMTDVEAAAA
jgi:hypothetical protein